MPTGYTADIAKGITFEQYALGCARAFGALIMMRDDPRDAPIPDDVSHHTTYHIDSIEAANTRMNELLTFTAADKQIAADLMHESECKRAADRQLESNELLCKYNAMKQQAIEYAPPSPEHEEYKRFMISQIEESIKWDCGDYPDPVKLTSDEWYAAEIAKAQRDIDYHTKEQIASVERDKCRNLWVKQLKDSLNK